MNISYCGWLYNIYSVTDVPTDQLLQRDREVFRDLSVYKMYFPFLLVFIVAASANASTCTFDMESESGNSQNRRYHSSASGGFTVLLMEGQILEIHFEVTRGSNCSVSIENVVYLNDGGADAIQVSLNGEKLGEFTTIAQAVSGDSDNSTLFLNTEAFGNHTQLTVGRYTVALTVLEADRFGVEIDKITFAIECTGGNGCVEIEIIDSTNPPTGSENDNSLSVGAIVGIVFGVTATILAIPGSILACYKLYKYKNKKN